MDINIRLASIDEADFINMKYDEVGFMHPERVPYLDVNNQPAARHIYHTPEGWTLPEIKF